MKKKQPVSPDVYTTEYFLTECNGYEDFVQTKGKMLNDRLKKVFSLAELKKGMKILDIGCGRGELVVQAAECGCEVVGVDYSDDSLRLTQEAVSRLSPEKRKNVRLLQADAKHLPFSKESFDVIFMIDFVEHLHDWELQIVFQKCSKMLKKKGILVIHTSPNKLYIDYLYPFLRLGSLLLGRDIGPVRQNYPDKREHVNEQTPFHLQALLREKFESRVWCENIHRAKWVNGIPVLHTFAISIFALAYPKS